MKNLLNMFLLVSLLTVMGCQDSDTNNLPPKDTTIKECVTELIADAGTDEQKIERIYYFVRDEIKFGWIYPQEISAEEVLRNRRGVCMQKANLLVAMAREAGLDARFHFMYVHKTALEDFLPDFAYKRWIDPFPHTFPEIYLNGKWVSMEATFDRELHEICIRKKLNFGRNEEIVRKVSIEFSADGVKGHQQYVHAEGGESCYGEDLTQLTEFTHEGIPWWKRMMLPVIFKKSQKIMNQIRSDN